MKYLTSFNIVFVIITLLMLTLSYNVSMSGDEPTQVKIGNNILNFYKTFGEDDTALKPDGIDQLQYYGSSFDTFCQFFINVFNIEDIYRFRHLMNGLIGAFIILFIGLFGKLLKNENTGIIAMILALLSPQLLGHSFNNPKDIPFALGYIMSLYFIAKWFIDIDKIDRKTILFLILSIAFTNSIRFGGIVLYGYLGLFLIFIIVSKSGLKNIFNYKKQIGISLLIVLISYFLSLIFWPYGLVSPIENPLKTLSGFENVEIWINQLFDGKFSISTELPFYYLSKYILITTPLIILFGFIIFLWKQVASSSYRKNVINYLLLFATVFPLLYIMYKGSNVYGGWRHVLFIYPSLVVLSSLGISHLFDLFSTKYPKLNGLKWLMLSVSLSHPIKHIITNHPYEYIYFNEIIGGVKNAYGKYEMDYYYNSTKEASLWLKDYIKQNHNTSNDTIVTLCNNKNYEYYFKDESKIETTYARFYDRHLTDWDYYISINTHIHPYQLNNNYWPPKGTIHTIKVDDKPICAIIKRPSKDDYKGSTLMNENKFAEAIPYFLNYLKVDSTNSSVLASLANSYIGIEDYDSTLLYANKALKYHKNHIIALDMIGRVHIVKQEYDQALKTYETIIKEKPNFFMAYYFQAYIYFLKKDYRSSLKKAELCLGSKKDFKPAFKLIGSIKQEQGNVEEAKYYFDKAK